MKTECTKCKYTWDYNGDSKYYITCPRCLMKIKSPLRGSILFQSKQILPELIALNMIEKKALIYLVRKGIDIDYSNCKLSNKPDLVSKAGEGFEIKKLMDDNHILFEENQIKNFDDDVTILIFKESDDCPYLEVKMADVRNKITEHGRLSISKIKLKTGKVEMTQ